MGVQRWFLFFNLTIGTFIHFVDFLNVFCCEIISLAHIRWPILLEIVIKVEMILHTSVHTRCVWVWIWGLCWVSGKILCVCCAVCVCVVWLFECSLAKKKWTKDLNGSRRYCLWWPFWIIFLIWFYWIIWIAQFAQFVWIIFKNNTSVLGIQSDDVSRAQSISLSHWEAGSVLEIAEFGMFVCLFYGTKE